MKYILILLLLITGMSVGAFPSSYWDDEPDISPRRHDDDYFENYSQNYSVLDNQSSLLQNELPSTNEVTLKDYEKQTIQLPKTNINSKESLIINDEQVLSELINLQKEKDVEDIENLWKGTVENNQVIGFALKKLSTPESQRRIHSSLMAKTLSAVVAGASLAPSLIGADYAVQSAGFAAGRLAQNLINRKTMPTEIPLTDTELIELAGLVENLQDKIITAYYNYKSSLTQLKEARQKLLLYNKNYAKGLDDEDLMEIAISSSLYDNMQVEEFYYMELAKKYHLELQRLAGKKVVDKLNLYQFNYNSTLIGEKAVRK